MHRIRRVTTQPIHLTCLLCDVVRSRAGETDHTRTNDPHKHTQSHSHSCWLRSLAFARASLAVRSRTLGAVKIFKNLFIIQSSTRQPRTRIQGGAYLPTHVAANTKPNNTTTIQPTPVSRGSHSCQYFCGYTIVNHHHHHQQHTQIPAHASEILNVMSQVRCNNLIIRSLN